MKENYRAWDVAIHDFPRQGSEFDRLSFLLRFAVLAPSGHNTQPWNFSITGNTVSLWVNRERSLEGSDPERRQLLIAFGCMIENLAIAADHYGYSIDMHYFPKAEDPDLITTVSFNEKTPSIKENSEDLFMAIPSRHTNRGQYLDRPLPENFLTHIEHYQTEGLRIFTIVDKSEKDAIADIVEDAGLEIMDNAGFREELSHYIRPSFTKEHTGMPGFALEIPAPISIVASHLIKKVNLSRSNKKKDEALLKQYTPSGFIIIASEKDDAAGRLAAGRLFENIWLTATAQGLDCSPLAAAIQSPRHTQALQEVLHTPLQPEIFFRIGYGKKQFRHSPRFSVEQLLIVP